MLIKHIPQVIRHIIRFFELRTVESLKAKPKKSTTSTILPTQKLTTRIKHGKIDKTQQSWPQKNNRVAGQIWRAHGRFLRRACNAGPFFPLPGPREGGPGLFPKPRWRCFKVGWCNPDSPPICTQGMEFRLTDVSTEFMYRGRQDNR